MNGDRELEEAVEVATALGDYLIVLLAKLKAEERPMTLAEHREMLRRRWIVWRAQQRYFVAAPTDDQLTEASIIADRKALEAEEARLAGMT